MASVMTTAAVPTWEKRIDVNSLRALAERIVPVDGESRIDNKIMDFFSSDLAQYFSQLETLEHRLVGEGLRDPALCAQFSQATHAIIAKGERVVAGLDKGIAKRVKEAFREALQPWAAGNPFVERCLKKPRGYAGDFAMMDIGYDNQPVMSGGLAGAFDRYFSDTYECVRQRKEKLQQAIRPRLLETASSKAPLRMLSLGSGPCREWVDLDREFRAAGVTPPAIRKVQLTCIDKDPEAVAYSQARLAGNGVLDSVEYVETDLFHFTKADRWRTREHSYDFVYGVGIANYFYEAMLQSVIASALTLVKPGGELLVTHKDRNSFNFPVADWLCDWVFLKRSAEEFSASFQEVLSASSGQFAYRLERIPNGEMFFGFAKRLTV